MYAEDRLLPISALQHLMFCERQCALIHIEGLWEENRLTVEGNILHQRTHDAGGGSRPGLRVARGLPLRSLRLGLVGIADVVEFHRATENDAGAGSSLPAPAATACALPGARGLWRPFPVEYKRGKPKRNRCDEVQLCAQALCLEETLNVKIASGALFYGTIRRRADVAFDTPLRDATEAAARRLHELIDAGATPKAIFGKWCKNCSLINQCMPKATAGTRSARQYMEAALEQTE